jgi:hypothetical protein
MKALRIIRYTVSNGVLDSVMVLIDSQDSGGYRTNENFPDLPR